jgi:hypothetical protein
MEPLVFVPLVSFFPNFVSIATGTLKEQFEISVLETERSFLQLCASFELHTSSPDKREL